MKRFSASYIITSTGSLLKNGIIEMDDDNNITNIQDTKGEIRELSNMEYHSGIITAGFVNSHCHLELSHLKGSVDKGKGMGDFVKSIPENRNKFSSEDIKKAIQNMDALMHSNGIKAVADISNTSDSLDIKKKSSIHYHTFIEVFGLKRAEVDSIIGTANLLKSEFEQHNLSCNITPHAPYSLSNELWGKLNNISDICSIHNQESKIEQVLFEEKSGGFVSFIRRFSPDFNLDTLDSKSSLEFSVKRLNPSNNILFVHNTFSKKEDIDLANSLLNPEQVFWCFCPNSNLYIEQKLPQIDLFHELKQKITVGTDSLASNESLSVLEELATIQKSFPSIPFTTLIEWATINGAKFLKLEDKFGSIEIGKSPGLNLITGVDLDSFMLSNKSKIKVLV